MDFGEQTTGTRDEHYNLVSVLYHALHGAENCERYVLDAETAGDERLAAFFRETQAAQMETAERAKGLLGIGVDVASEARGDAMPGAAPSGLDETSSDAEPVDVRGRVAPEVGLPPEGGGTPGDLPPDAPTEEISPTTNAPRTPSPGTPRGTGEVTPPRSDDVQREAQREADVRHETNVRAEEVDVSTERGMSLEPDEETTPPARETAEDVALSRGVSSADAPAEGEDVARSESAQKAVPPDAPRTEDPPPRRGDAPPSPSEQPPR